MPLNKTPAPGGGGMEFIISVDPSLFIITMHLVCMDHAPERKRRIFNTYINFIFFSSKLPHVELESMNFAIICLLTMHMLHTKFGQVWPSSS